MGAVKTPYDQDLVAWADETAAAVRSGQIGEVDLEHLAEEIEGLAGRDRRAASSQLRRLIMHLLKMKHQPTRRSRSWETSVLKARIAVGRLLKESPSLEVYLRRELQDIWQEAVILARSETGVSFDVPDACPWSLEWLLMQDIETLVQH